MAATDVLGASRVLLLVLALPWFACSFDARFDGTKYRCGAAGACPTGFRCVAEVDASDPVDVDASPGVDGSGPGPDGGGATPRFSDDFGGSGLGGWIPWDHPGCSVAEANGYLELNYTGNGAYCGADTSQAFDLRNGAVTVEVVEAPVLSNHESYLLLFVAQQQIHMIRSPTGLVMRFRSGGQYLDSLTVPNDTAARFWRIREQSGTTYWDTSTDGANWTMRHSAPTRVDASSLNVELAAGGALSTVRVRFDQVRVY